MTVKINVCKQGICELVENQQELNVYSLLLNECRASNVMKRLDIKQNPVAEAQIGVRLHQPELQ